MHVTVLKEVPEDPQLAASWNELVMRMERPEVFYTHQWALAASRAFRESVQPLICLVHESDRLCGVAALATLHDSREDRGDAYQVLGCNAGVTQGKFE